MRQNAISLEGEKQRPLSSPLSEENLSSIKCMNEHGKHTLSGVILIVNWLAEKNKWKEPSEHLKLNQENFLKLFVPIDSLKKVFFAQVKETAV